MGSRPRRIAEERSVVVLCMGRDRAGGSTYLERREHLALFLAVEQTVVVLHRDEWGEVVGDCVACGGGDAS